MLSFLLVLAVCLVFLSVVKAQIPCDSAYGEFCPEAAGLEVGECLKKQKSSLTKACVDYINLHDVCKQDIETHCVGKEYTGDLMVCLTEWTSPSSLSSECLSSLPKKEEKKRTLSAAEKKKAEERKRQRNKAARKMKKEL